MDERIIILQKLDLLRQQYYKDIYIPYDPSCSTFELQIEYNLALDRVREFHEDNDLKRTINTNSIIVLEILKCKVSDTTIKKRIQKLQQSYVWTLSSIRKNLNPLIDYCIIRNRYDIKGYVGAALIYWFVTSDLVEYKDVILDSIKDEPWLIDIINDF
jgi:hypothetical protein